MRIIKDGLHYPAEAFRSFHPNVAFVGDVPPVAALEAHGWKILRDDPIPETPGKIAERGPVEWRAGVPYWTWVERDPTPEEVAQKREQLQRKARNAYSEAMRPISAAYPPEEREGWAEQVAAAQEVVTGGQNDLIDALRHPTGETALEMAQRIIAKRAEYLVSYGQVTAARRGVEAQIEAANTLADLEAIDVRAAFGLG
jgi:hypothetical protein